MRKRLKSLITEVEKLGLDTQGIRDVLSDPSINLSEIENKVENLEREVSKHPPNSQPFQVQVLVKHLKPRPREATFKTDRVEVNADNYIIQKHESLNTDDKVVGVVENALEAFSKQLAAARMNEIPSAGDTSENVLKAIEALSSKVDNIKIKGDIKEEDPNAPKIKEEFVNPLDEEEVRKLKGNVHVVPKKGKSLASSLKKLRGLKK